MKNYLQPFLYILLVTLLTPLYADVYRYVDKNGNVIFTDSPPEGSNAKKIVVKEPTTESAFEPAQSEVYLKPAPTKKPTKNTSASINYSISVSSPENGIAINAPGGSLNVVVSVQPPPQQEYKIRIMVDGYEAATSDSPIATVTGLNRGQHSINAQLLDSEGVVLATSHTNVVTILRPSIIIRERNKNKKD